MQINKLYWFYEHYDFTGKLLCGKLVGVNIYNIARIQLENGTVWNLDADYLFASKESLMATKENKMKKEKIDELGK